MYTVVSTSLVIITNIIIIIIFLFIEIRKASSHPAGFVLVSASIVEYHGLNIQYTSINMIDF